MLCYIIVYSKLYIVIYYCIVARPRRGIHRDVSCLSLAHAMVQALQASDVYFHVEITMCNILQALLPFIGDSAYAIFQYAIFVKLTCHKAAIWA